MAQKTLASHLKGIIVNWRSFLENRKNTRLRKRLTNSAPTLICSNCAGGIIYHWLGLQFQSPFINLYMSNEDFLIAMENIEEFLSTPIVEETDTDKPYPVGIGYKGVRINFMHYKTFEEAIRKWEERKSRINFSNLGVVLSNYKGADADRVVKSDGSVEHVVAQRFDKLPFKRKILVSDQPLPYDTTVCLKGWKPDSGINIWGPKNLLTGSRYIDQWDFVEWINALRDDRK